MKTKHLFFLLVTVSAMATNATAYTLSIDPAAVSMSFDQFNDGTDTTTGFNNMATAGEAGGVSSVTVNPGAADPQFQVPTPGAAFSTATHPYFRIQAQRSAGGAPDGIFPLPPAGATKIGYDAPGSFSESQFAFINTAPGVNGTGFRIDPINGGTAGTETFDVDYIWLDQYQTIGLGEFDRDGGFDGWTASANGHLSGGTVSAATGTFQATTSGNDPVLQKAGLNYDTNLYTNIEISLALDPASTSRFEFFWGTSTFPGPAGGQSIGITSELIRDGNLHTYRFDMSDEASWDGNLNILRLDLLADADAAAGRSVEVGHVRLIAAIPEPSSTLLVFGALAAMTFRRRR